MSRDLMEKVYHMWQQMSKVSTEMKTLRTNKKESYLYYMLHCNMNN